MVCCLEDGDLFGVKLCCSLPVCALCVRRGAEIVFASKAYSLQGGSVLLLPKRLKAHQEWCGVSSPSLVPLYTEVPHHQLNTTAAPKGQDLSAWM